MAIISLQFQKSISYVDPQGRFNPEALRALNALATQVSDIAQLFDIAGALGADLAGIAGAPVVTHAATAAFANERVLGAVTPISVIYGPSAATVTFTGYTDNVPEGVLNLYYTDARARLAINGSTTVSYNSASGIISLTPANVAAALGYTPYDAANPAGYATSGGASSLNIRTIAATATPAATDYTLLCDASAGAIVVNLAAAAGQNKRILAVKKIDASANTVTIDPNGAELIDGAATFVLSAQYDGITAHCNGTGWWII